MIWQHADGLSLSTQQVEDLCFTLCPARARAAEARRPACYAMPDGSLNCSELSFQ